MGASVEGGEKQCLGFLGALSARCCQEAFRMNSQRPPTLVRVSRAFLVFGALVIFTQ